MPKKSTNENLNDWFLAKLLTFPFFWNTFPTNHFFSNKKKFLPKKKGKEKKTFFFYYKQCENSNTMKISYDTVFLVEKTLFLLIWICLWKHLKHIILKKGLFVFYIVSLFNYLLKYKIFENEHNNRKYWSFVYKMWIILNNKILLLEWIDKILWKNRSCKVHMTTYPE